MTYDQLIPSARNLLNIPAVHEHYAYRFATVICDECQDTSAEEWELLQAIAPSARRILLGDVNKSIYGGFKPDVAPAARLAAALTLPGAVQVDLSPASYREPTGVLPAAAEAARTLRFRDPAIAEAARTSRLCLTCVPDGACHRQVVDLTRQARCRCHTVSIFTHTNAATTAVSDAALDEAGLTHEQIGFGEAHGEALAAQLALIQYALGDDDAPVCRQLAVFITATIRRGPGVPELAQQMLRASNPIWERSQGDLASDLRSAG
ncbi:UvrD-helicase domain-containing protein [Streptomyces sp. NPDC051940]|uniref:UvrD-helicase domain-containing protein n=1 Tax=Streptomyces sp. NPDC051940 TaxID=3155675 RepID=UPI003412C932